MGSKENGIPMTEKVFFVWVRNLFGDVEPQLHYDRLQIVKEMPSKIVQKHEIPYGEARGLTLDQFVERYPYQGKEE
jgi:hypothetical protein